MLKLEKIIKQKTKKAEFMLTKTDIKTLMEYYNRVCQLFKAADPSAQSYEVSIITCSYPVHLIIMVVVNKIITRLLRIVCHNTKCSHIPFHQ